MTSAEMQSSFAERVNILRLNFIAVAEAFAHHACLVKMFGERSGFNRHILRAKSHACANDAFKFFLVWKFANECVRGFWIELGAICVGKAQHIARKFNHRHLKTKANAKERQAGCARVFHAENFSLYAALTKSTGHNDAIHALKNRGHIRFGFKRACVHPFQINRSVQPNAAMLHGFINACVGVAQTGVLAHHANCHAA